MFDEDAKAKFALYAAMTLTFLGYGGRWLGIEPLHDQFFAFAAWAYALLLDNLNYRLLGSSLFVSRTGGFAAAAAGSLLACSLAELLNVRLGAWHYMYLPSTFSVRWAFRAMSWSALLPCAAVTGETMAAILKKVPSAPGFAVTPALAKRLYISGYLLLGLALAWPSALWPLALPAAALLADPAALKFGLPSTLGELSAGRPAAPLSLLLSGAACGLLWRALDDAAGAHRVLSAPWSGPAAAAAGGALFTLAATPLSELAALAMGWRAASGREAGEKPFDRNAVWAAIAAAALCYAAFRAADAYSAGIYLGWV